MVQLMEAWFLADPAAMAAYYGRGFRAAALEGPENVEDIPKKDVLAILERATRHTLKGAYHKTRHAPGILARVDPRKVQSRSTECTRLFTVLRALISPSL